MWCELLHGEVGGVIVAKHADPGSLLPSQQHLLDHLIYWLFECMFDNLSKHLPHRHRQGGLVPKNTVPHYRLMTAVIASAIV
jgi:hypothetical protein